MEKLEKAMEMFHETVRYTHELSDTYKKAEKDLDNYRSVVENANKVVEKSLKAQKTLDDLHEGLSEKKSALKEEILDICNSVAPQTDGTSNISSLLQELEKEKTYLCELQEKLVEMKKQQKEIEFAKVEFKLQQAALPLRMDVNSTRNNFKGFIKKSTGQVEFVDYDLTKGNSVQIADELWGHVHVDQCGKA